MIPSSFPPAIPSSPAPSRRLGALLILLTALAILPGGAATVLFDGESRPAVPIPRAVICDAAPGAPAPDDFRLALEATATPGAKEPIVATTTEDPAERLRLWRIRLSYFQGTSNGIGGLLAGDINAIEQNGLGLTVNRMLIQDLWKTPINILVQGGLMWHNEKGAQSDTWQGHLSLNFEWDLWPWNNYLRTRFAVATGISYVNQIPYTEIVNRGKSSKNLLQFLEPSLSLNCGDLIRLVRIHRLFPGWDSRGLDHTWLIGSIPHRSGVWGLYGNDSDGDPISGGSNYLSIGIETEF